MISVNYSKQKNFRNSAFLLVLVLFSIETAIAQIAPEKYFVKFTDKSATTFSLSNPQDFLSQKALDRRSSQSIAIDSNDLPVVEAYVQQIFNCGQINILYRTRWLNGVVIQTTDTAALNCIESLPIVDTADSRLLAGKKGSDRYFESIEITKDNEIQSYPIYGETEAQITQVNLQRLHNMGYRGNGMTIAVLDNGFRHVDTSSVFEPLFQENRIVATRDFVDPQNHDVYDDGGHGTDVLAMMGVDIGFQAIGAAPEAEYMLIVTEDNSGENIIEEYNWIAGAEFADSAGADIINTSLSYTEFDDPGQSHTYSELDGKTTVAARGANLAASRGMLIVVSAGNFGNDPWQKISTPADADNALTIGSVNEDGEWSGFSSLGPAADGDIKPNVVARGSQAAIPSATNIGQIERVTGTSFSSPLIAGAAACLWQGLPNFKWSEIKQAIEQSSSIYDNPNEQLGYGIPDFHKAYQLADAGLLSAEVINQSRNVKVYPNPARNFIDIEVIAPNPYTIYDARGSLIEIGRVEKQKRINLSDWAAGVYYLKINGQQFPVVVLE